MDRVNSNTGYLLCSPVFVPQMTLDPVPPGLVTVNWSVSQLPKRTAAVPPAVGTPCRTLVSVTVLVVGPAIMNVLKSNRS